MDIQNNMKEEWKDIEGYEGLYQASNLGRVRSLKFGKVKILKPGKSSNGYLFVVLCKDGITKKFKVHRLVAKSFLGDWSYFCPEINHIDEDKTNNRVENLEWCDHKYNVGFGTRAQRMIETRIKNGTVDPELVGLPREERKKLWYQKHKEERKEYLKKYREEHKEQIKLWNQKHKEERKEYFKQRYLKTKMKLINKHI